MPTEDIEVDATVRTEDHPFTGKIVAAKFKLSNPEPLKEFKKRVLKFCKNRMPSYKIPGKIVITEETTYNERFKRMRRFSKEHAE